MRNSNITYESILACYLLLYVENKKDFAALYEVGTHESGGCDAWKLTENKRLVNKMCPKVKPKKIKIKLHWYTDGKKNVKVAECPAGYHPGKVGKFKNMYGDCWR